MRQKLKCPVCQKTIRFIHAIHDNGSMYNSCAGHDNKFHYDFHYNIDQHKQITFVSETFCNENYLTQWYLNENTTKIYEVDDNYTTPIAVVSGRISYTKAWDFYIKNILIMQ